MVMGLLAAVGVPARGPRTATQILEPGRPLLLRAVEAHLLLLAGGAPLPQDGALSRALDVGLAPGPHRGEGAIGVRPLRIPPLQQDALPLPGILQRPPIRRGRQRN